MIKISRLSCKKNLQDTIDFIGVLDNVNSIMNLIPNKNTKIFKSRQNNKLEFLQKGYFFSPPIIVKRKFIISNLKSNQIFFSKGMIIKNNMLILNNDFKMFVNCFYCNITKDIRIILPFDVIGRNLITKRIKTILEKVLWFTKTYLEFKVEIKLNVYIFNFLKRSSLEPVEIDSNEIFLDLQYVIFPEKRFKGFKTNMRITIKRFLLAVFLQNGFLYNELLNGFTSLLCFYFEFIVFENRNELLYIIFKDYKNNRRKSTYFFLRILNDRVKNDENVLSLHYLNLLKFFIIKPFNLESVCKKFNVPKSLLFQDYPVLKINIDEVPQDHIYYLKINIESSSTFLNEIHLETKLYERICKRKVYLGRDINQCGNCISFFYNCRGRLFKERKDLSLRKTQPPDKLFHYIEFNYNGKLPCHLIINNINQKMQIMLKKCCFWTKLVCLDNLIMKKTEPRFEDIHNLIKDVYFLNSNKDGYSKLIKLLTTFLFNESTFKKHICYKLKIEEFKFNQTYLNFAIGLYKNLFGNKSIKIDNIWNPVKYNLRKCLLKQISIQSSSNEKVKRFFSEVVEDFRFNNSTCIDFYDNCLKKHGLL